MPEQPGGKPHTTNPSELKEPLTRQHPDAAMALVDHRALGYLVLVELQVHAVEHLPEVLR